MANYDGPTVHIASALVLLFSKLVVDVLGVEKKLEIDLLCAATVLS